MIDLDFICYSLDDFKEKYNNILLEVNEKYKGIDYRFILIDLKDNYRNYLKAVDGPLMDNLEINAFHLQGYSIKGITELIYPNGLNGEYDEQKASLLNFNFKLIIGFLDNEIKNISNNPQRNISDSLIDYSDVGAKEKVIALKELGIIEYLQKEFSICQTSTNKIAEVLSLLTGEKSGTIQSYINPMINEGTSQKNNPYNNINTVEKTKNKLNTIGVFKSK